jgi:lipopolysaccharide biosynthesis regulator YciM
VNDLVVFGLLFIAIAIGWYLGRRSARPVVTAPDLPSQYYKGLNYLLDGRPDGAIDAFINALEVNSETLETHIALGNLLRKKGEVDRAIRIHQNLLARPSLPRSQIHQAHLELARDYISAGLLDRAERLLLDLVEESPEQRRASQRHLLEIYQSEQEWQRAIEVAGDLLPRKSLLGSAGAEPAGEPGQQVSVALSHYHCELADQKRAAGDFQGARELLQEALARDKLCARASIMLGKVECESGNYKQAVKALRRVPQQDPDYVSETIATLRQCYSEMGDAKSLRVYLEECLDAQPSAPLVMAATEDILLAYGGEVAGEFLSTQLARCPSLRGLEKLIGLKVEASEGKVRDDLDMLQVLVRQLIAERPAYQCSHCGFAGRNLHWFCPGCKYWGTMKTIRGTSME